MSQIIWLNGAFGGGKTQTAGELHRRLPGSFVYDPECFGFWLRKNEPPSLRTPDFQDVPLWREGNYLALRRIALEFDGIIIVPMTLTSPDYYNEIIGRLREDGINVTHVLLSATKETLRKRQRSRLDGPKSWAVRQISHCLKAFGNPRFENKLPTDGLSIPEVAEAVAVMCGLKLSPRKRGLRQKFAEVLTSLRAIRL